MCLTYYNNFGKVFVLRVRKEKVKIMTQQEIIEFVQNNARYYNDDSFEPYAVIFQGEPFWGESPQDLVKQISATLN